MAFSVEEALVGWLPTVVGAPCYAEVPADRPSEFVTVERTGGGSEIGIDRPSVAIQAWAPSRLEALRLALEVRDAMALRAVEVDGIRSCSVNSGPYSFPDPDGRGARYQLYVDMTTE